MAEPLDPAILAEIEDIRDEIGIKRAILASLEDSGTGSDDENLRKTTKKEIKRLRKHLRALGAEGESDDDRPGRSLNEIPQAPAEDHGLPSDSQNHLVPPATYKLASRKRQRDLFDDARPESSKSRRTTPSPALSTPASPALSSASLDSLDDPFLDSLLGLTKEEVELNQDFWRQKQQQENDEKLAQSLSQGEVADIDVNSAHPAIPRHSDYTQSFLRTNGSFVKSEPSSNSRSLPTIRPDPPSQLTPSALLNPISRVPVKLEPHRDNLSHIKNEPAASLSMPGAFPNTVPQQSSYSSVGGSSVYNPDIQHLPIPGETAWSLGDEDGLESFEHPLEGPRDDPQTQAELMNLLQHIRPDEELTANQMPEQPQGLKVSMMPHQLSGLAWMKRMEEGTNKGGILADDMGLGKTLQAIALMMERPPPPNKHRPTLIVAPVALLQQWKREIEKMVRSRYRMNVFILHGETRKATWSSLRAYDVVLTTYGLLASELKRKIALDEKVKRLQNYVPTVAEDCPVLGDRSRFHRVILDEAHNIKNRAAKAALAACRIEAEHRWCLTGTPMMNNSEEIFSLIRFCRIRPYCDWKRFQQDIAGPLKRKYNVVNERGMATLQALLRAILLRRTKHSNIHGQPILQLPPKETREDRVPFDKDQSEFYFALERSAQVVMNRYIQRGTVGSHYANVLVLLLRLRQACCHPYLVTASKDFVQLPGGELNTDVLMRNAERLDVRVVERLKQLEAYECPICMDGTENPSLFFCGHAICGDCLSRLTDNANDSGGRPKCPQCRADIDVNNVTDYTSFLRVHCPEHELVQGLAADEDESADSETDSDDSDSDEGDDLGGFIVPDTDIESETDSPKTSPKPKKSKRKSKSKSKSKGKGKGKAKVKELPKSLAELRKEGLRNKSARRKYLKKLKKNFQPSAKTTRTIELLEEIKNRGEKEKTIIFSNFTSYLDIVETILYDHASLSNYVRYDGSMSSNERNDAVLEFTDNPNCNIMLISLKAGNAGLNLTAANHVIMLDPFWNPFVEYQAADRCYRIGQQRDVTVHRIIIGKGESDDDEVPPPNGPVLRDPEVGGFTVEDRILDLQEKKRRLVETALDESAGQAVSRLGVRELGYLFGLNRL
ncbi:hypothetical protein H2200_000600 [Cladophialophora chaetospira]|uniref:ATP-dependent helicase n=1 Tax=Cladophialophora chaetospira TaxID=386627 RepID=A0AA38XNR2_9EURO|nr:hypothetical protein H2200_000600 [Cladophialophora chaetospira]